MGIEEAEAIVRAVSENPATLRELEALALDVARYDRAGCPRLTAVARKKIDELAACVLEGRRVPTERVLEALELRRHRVQTAKPGTHSTRSTA